jgi:hypothetical protein
MLSAQAGAFGQGSRALSMWRMDLPSLLGMPDRRVFRAVSVLEAAKAYGQKLGNGKKANEFDCLREYTRLILVQLRDTFQAQHTSVDGPVSVQYLWPVLVRSPGRFTWARA